MAACPSCGFEYEGSFKFCPECAAPLDAPVRPVSQERKVVTALFCDLIGFTATSESADPEDVDKMLSAYAGMARTQIESHGGVVEKFIGDAVVGVFGVPAAHEDDPERAVRAGLQIVEAAEELEAIGGAPLRLRVGINSGETLVRLGVTPGSGERMLAGDAINTASRIQSVAPEMGVAVGLTAYEATSTVFDYDELESATLKGKSEPVRVFHARSPLARIGIDSTRTHHSPYVGRAIELSLLRELFDESVLDTSVRFATVVGEPGIGKSRIVAELLGYAQEREPRLTWRQGRCLPYGDGVTFWALGEIVKAHAGILESDDPEQVSTKLGNSVPDGPDREWMRRRLLPLVGVDASSPAERDELFAAWRTFLETVAEQTPTVLVFEDLHWADDAMLAFLEHLARRSMGVPLLVLGTARPELYERHPDYAQDLGSRINLGPLSDEESLALISGLLDNSEIREMRIPILERADGNPLYVEEFLRLLKDRDLLVEEGGAWVLRPESELPVPGSIHSMLAARLDTLSPEQKAMLSDAAVVGKVFWAGAVAAMGDRELEDVTSAMRELSHKDLVRTSRRSSMQGESEYAFWHVLTRDVAYGQLPRASRAARHVAAARWIESKAPGRVEDLADVLAYHYAAAMELARAAGEPTQAADLVVQALRFLTLAGERALGLDTEAAGSNFARALELAPPGHPGRPEALVRFGEAAFQGGRNAEAAEALEEATAAFRARGDPAATARAMHSLSGPLQAFGDPRGWTMALEALALLEPLPPGPDLVTALIDVAGDEANRGRPEAGIRYAERALALAEELGLPRPAGALDFRGIARCTLGDPGGMSDLRDAITIASEAGDGHEVAKLYNNLCVHVWGFEGPAAALAIGRSGLDFARTRGLIAVLDFLQAGVLDLLIDTGELDEALTIADDMTPRKEENAELQDLLLLRAAQVRVASLRGQSDRLAPRVDWLEATVGELLQTPDFVIYALGSAALGRALLGPDGATASLLDRIETTPGTRETLTYCAFLPSLVRVALGIANRALAERLVHGLEPRSPYSEHALVAANAAVTEAHGHQQAAADGYADAADRWERFGVVPEHAFALLGHGRCLLGLSRPTEATPVLRHAREIFVRLGATPALAETDALLQQTSAPSS